MHYTEHHPHELENHTDNSFFLSTTSCHTDERFNSIIDKYKEVIDGVNKCKKKTSSDCNDTDVKTVKCVFQVFPNH